MKTLFSNPCFYFYQASKTKRCYSTKNQTSVPPSCGVRFGSRKRVFAHEPPTRRKKSKESNAQPAEPSDLHLHMPAAEPSDHVAAAEPSDHVAAAEPSDHMAAAEPSDRVAAVQPSDHVPFAAELSELHVPVAAHGEYHGSSIIL